ncbi:MAG: DMT family transporter [Sideroxyarcus sp.]|nr:DMT family transporter [Sideroxyarcus sp.]
MAHNYPAIKGALLAIAAAVLFGASTPLVQLAGRGVNAWMTAALLYLGAAIAGFLLRSNTTDEAPLQKQHWPRLILMALFGAVLGPAALAWGLQHTGAMGASLMLTLEAVFTVLLAIVLYREKIGRRVALALVIMTAGAALLVMDQADAGSSQAIGLLAVMAATFAWGIDNSLSRGLADLDPGQVILGKAALGAGSSLLIALMLGSAAISYDRVLALISIGAIGYGLSLRFYLLAQRSFGASRTGSLFAAAPFIGAVIAFGLGDHQVSYWLLGASLLMILGIVLHLTEEHEHLHHHDALEHEHAHRHDDGHHTHTHADMPAGAHSHKHQHTATEHRHPHVPDVHHDHSH